MPGLVPLISLNDHPIKDESIWPVISPEYSATVAYTIDSHVIYEDKLYRCIVTIDSPGEAWNPSHWVQTDVDEELNRGINQGIDALHVLAREYSSLQTYSSGTYVMKDSVFYRCTTDILSAEEWNPQHWTEVTVSEEIGSQKASLGTLQDIVADEYNPEQAYPKNSYIIKDGAMYRSLVDVAGLELWDLNKWEECTVGSEIGHSRTIDKFTQDSIAPEYSSDRTYVSGDLVMHNGKLYRCVSAVTVPEPFNAVHWGLTSVANEVSMTDISSIFGFYIDEDGYLAQSITSDGIDPSTVNLDEVLGFYISVDGYISQKTSA